MHRSLLRVVLVVLSMTASACKREKVSEAKATAGEATKATTKAEIDGCDAAHGQAIEQELLSQCKVMPQVLEVDVPTLPWKAAPSAMPENALWIDVSPQGAQLGGWGDTVSFTELPARFAGERERVIEMAVANGRPRPEGWVLSIEGNTTRLGVTVVLQTLADAGLPSGQLRLATHPTEPLPAPRDPKLLAELEAKVSELDPSDKAMELVAESKKVLPACPAADEVLSATSTTTNDPAERCTILARDVSQALVRCGCAKEAEILTMLYVALVGVRRPERLGTNVAVTLDPTAAPLPGDVWSQVVANLEEAKLTAVWVSPT